MTDAKNIDDPDAAYNDDVDAPIGTENNYG